MGLSSLQLETQNHKLETHNKQNHMTTSSPERLAANRANAQKSTGPKTSEGKAASKMNAVKHGILSREVLVAGENEAELTAFHESFREDLQPVGARQEMLVDMIVTTHWRLRRLLAVESGEMALSVERGDTEKSRTEMAKRKTQETAESCRHIQIELHKLVQKITEQGDFSLRTLFECMAAIGPKSPLSLELRALRDRCRDKAEVLAFAEKKIQELGLRAAEHERREAECREEAEEVNRPMVAFLPSPEAMDKIIRYESMLNRQLFRAMKELRTLQKEREEKNPKTEFTKSERNPKAEVREGATLPNEPILERERERGGRGERGQGREGAGERGRFCETKPPMKLEKKSHGWNTD